jgi:very-short-patch-repair endonuclease
MIDLIAPIQAGRKIAGVRRRFVPPPSEWEVTNRDGVPSTTASRAIVDLAGGVGARLLGGTIEQAAVRGLLDLAEIDRILAGPWRRRGSPMLRAILEDWRGYRPGMRIRSAMEAKLLSLLIHRRLPMPEVNHKLHLEGKTFEVDFLWPERKVVLETDGAAFHDNPRALGRDSLRNRALAKAGYIVQRLGWEDLRDRPEATMDEIARLLAASRSTVP